MVLPHFNLHFIHFSFNLLLNYLLNKILHFNHLRVIDYLFSLFFNFYDTNLFVYYFNSFFYFINLFKNLKNKPFFIIINLIIFFGRFNELICYYYLLVFKKYRFNLVFKIMLKNQAYLWHRPIPKKYHVTLKMSLILKYCYFSQYMRCRLKYIIYPYHYLFRCKIIFYLNNLYYFVFQLLVPMKVVSFYFFIFYLFQFLLDF